ncbi:hypothetical protein [Agromyces sp. NPDC058104]|uniref:hypothetical protein n=1 Tax=Agromyces sp. NPDC058104 TaxID=3346342 RepID=UPI0036DD4D7F
MSLIFIDSFDAQDATAKWVSTLASAPSYAEVPRYALGSCVKAASAGRLTKPFPAAAQIVMGFAFKVDNLSAAHLLAHGWADSGATQHAGIQVSTTGQIQVMRGGTVAASSAAGLIVAGNWYFIELRATIADSGGVAEVKLNGTQIINFSGDTKNAGTATTFDMVSLGGASTMDTAVTYDDFYLLNTSGSAPNNTFLGEVVIQALLPNAAGAHTDFTPIGSGANYQNVDEIPPSGSDYNASSTVGAKDSYGVTNLSGSVGTIFGVQENMHASKTGVGAANLKSLVRSGGTDYTQPAVALGASQQWYGAIREVDPATSAAWVASAVNALEVGAEVA